MISNMNSALHIGVLPPPDLKSLFSPGLHPLLPSANQLSYLSLSFRNMPCTSRPPARIQWLGGSLLWLLLKRGVPQQGCSSFLPRLTGRKGFCINHTALCQALPRPGGVSPWTQIAEAKCTTKLMQCYMVQSKTLEF